MHIITISRLVGAYGDVIAAIVARRMGLDLIGREELHEMAQSCDPEYRDACAVSKKSMAQVSSNVSFLIDLPIKSFRVPDL